MRKRFVVTICTAFLLLFAATAAYSYGYSAPYGSGTWSPGEQHGGSYDCPYSNYFWILNGFAKSAYRNGKSIFIDTSGHWIGVAEDNDTYTLLFRSDLEFVTKKGSAKNTSAYTYSGHGSTGYNEAYSCV